jgi:hypothetical protein
VKIENWKLGIGNYIKGKSPDLYKSRRFANKFMGHGLNPLKSFMGGKMKRPKNKTATD